MKRLLRGGRVVDPASGLDGMYDVLIDGDRIAQVDGFVTPRFFPAFELPDVLEEPAGP